MFIHISSLTFQAAAIQEIQKIPSGIKWTGKMTHQR